jgi:RNA polymerase sigma-70 factor (ECF subfamily)
MMKRDPLSDPGELIRRVYSYVAYRIGAGADAEDVTSEVMLRAVRYRGSYDPSKGRPLMWLLGIAHNCVDDHLASRPLTPAERPEVAAPGELETEAIDRMAVGCAVARLAERDRELVALRYGGGLSTRQISQILGLSRNAVDVALHRTRTRLSDELHREGYDRRSLERTAIGSRMARGLQEPGLSSSG